MAGFEGKNGLLRNRRGDNFIYEIMIFIVLNILFFTTMSIFVARSSTGAIVYEQAYAKEIALVLDNSKPGSEHFIDMSEGVSIAKNLQNLKSTSDADMVKKIVTINEQANNVYVSLDGKMGYSFQYFSDCKIETGAEGVKLRVACIKPEIVQSGAQEEVKAE